MLRQVLQRSSSWKCLTCLYSVESMFSMVSRIAPHCNENSIYVFLFWQLCGLSPNFHSHVFMRYLYFPRIVGIYKSLEDTWVWKSGQWPRNSFSGNKCFEFSVLCSACSMLRMGPLHEKDGVDVGKIEEYIHKVRYICTVWAWYTESVRGGSLLPHLPPSPPVPCKKSQG